MAKLDFRNLTPGKRYKIVIHPQSFYGTLRALPTIDFIVPEAPPRARNYRLEVKTRYKQVTVYKNRRFKIYKYKVVAGTGKNAGKKIVNIITGSSVFKKNKIKAGDRIKIIQPPSPAAPLPIVTTGTTSLISTTRKKYKGVVLQNTITVTDELGFIDVTNISIGDGASGIGIANGATVTAINETTGVITLSAANTGSTYGKYCNGTINQNTITVSVIYQDTSYIQVGDYVTGTGIGTGARVTAIDATNKRITLSVNNTGSFSNQTITFAREYSGSVIFGKSLPSGVVLAINRDKTPKNRIRFIHPDPNNNLALTGWTTYTDDNSLTNVKNYPVIHINGGSAELKKIPTVRLRIPKAIHQNLMWNDTVRDFVHIVYRSANTKAAIGGKRKYLVTDTDIDRNTPIQDQTSNGNLIFNINSGYPDGFPPVFVKEIKDKKYYQFEFIVVRYIKNIINRVCTGSSGQSTITSTTDVAGIKVGNFVTGTGIGSGAKVTAINGNIITLSVLNSAAVSGTITFSGWVGDWMEQRAPFDKKLSRPVGWKDR